MITKITGVLARVLDEEVRVQVGGLEYQVLVAEFVRRKIQDKQGQEISLHTAHYLDGNPMQGRVVPRLLGFVTETELDFFELFCTVDKVGTDVENAVGRGHRTRSRRSSADVIRA